MSLFILVFVYTTSGYAVANVPLPDVLLYCMNV